SRSRASRPSREPLASPEPSRPQDRRADWRTGPAQTTFSLQTAMYVRSLQNRCGRATHGSVGSTPAPLRDREVAPSSRARRINRRGDCSGSGPTFVAAPSPTAPRRFGSRAQWTTPSPRKPSPTRRPNGAYIFGGAWEQGESFTAFLQRGP